MWLMNKIANPFVSIILRSPMHGMMSAALLLITYRGRRSGKDFTLPVQYIQDNCIIYIVPGTPEKKTWWRNLRGGAPVQLRLAGKALTGRAVVLDGSADVERVTQGFNMFLRRFPAVAKLHDIHVEQEGLFNQEDVRRAALSLIMVRVDLDP